MKQIKNSKHRELTMPATKNLILNARASDLIYSIRHNSHTQAHHVQ